MSGGWWLPIWCYRCGWWMVSANLVAWVWFVDFGLVVCDLGLLVC